MVVIAVDPQKKRSHTTCKYPLGGRWSNLLQTQQVRFAFPKYIRVQNKTTFHRFIQDYKLLFVRDLKLPEPSSSPLHFCVLRCDSVAADIIRAPCTLPSWNTRTPLVYYRSLVVDTTYLWRIIQSQPTTDVVPRPPDAARCHDSNKTRLLVVLLQAASEWWW